MIRRNNQSRDDLFYMFTFLSAHTIFMCTGKPTLPLGRGRKKTNTITKWETSFTLSVDPMHSRKNDHPLNECHCVTDRTPLNDNNMQFGCRGFDLEQVWNIKTFARRADRFIVQYWTVHRPLRTLELALQTYTLRTRIL